MQINKRLIMRSMRTAKRSVLYHFNRTTLDAIEEGRRISRDPHAKSYSSMEELVEALEK